MASFELVRPPLAMELRASVRFPIQTQLQYRALNGSTPDCGRGRTLNISSSGILFEADNSPRPGQRLEIRIKWPVHSDKGASVALVAIGRVMRVEGNRVAFAISRYSFCSDRSERDEFPSAIAG